MSMPPTQKVQASAGEPSRLGELAAAAVADCGAEALSLRWAQRHRVPEGRWHLFGAGKSAAAMARGLMAAHGPPASALLVGKVAESLPVDLLLGSHPVPSVASQRAYAALEKALRAVPAEQAVVFALSGGASSLLAAPVEGLELSRLQALSSGLLASAKPIAEINRLRRQLLRGAGGRLAGHCRGTVHVLVLSDVLGNDLATIGSGPFVPLRPGERGDWPKELAGLSPPPLPPVESVADVSHHIIGDWQLLQRRALARLKPVFSVVAWAPESSEVREVAQRYRARIEELAPGQVAVGGGEPTVALPAESGRGGRNLQLALWMARHLAGGQETRFLALASDGDDGNSGCAGALVDHRTWQSIEAAGIDPLVALEQANAYPALKAAGALLHGSLGKTNVLDLHLLQRLK